MDENIEFYADLYQVTKQACALVHTPELLILDEPTCGVDPNSRRNLWELIGDMAQRGVTVLVTTHYLDEVEYCDRLVA